MARAAVQGDQGVIKHTQQQLVVYSGFGMNIIRGCTLAAKGLQLQGTFIDIVWQRQAGGCEQRSSSCASCGTGTKIMQQRTQAWWQQTSAACSSPSTLSQQGLW
jgi:hypothetical protein